MKNIFTVLALLYSFNSFGQQACETLFHKFNPKYNSIKTSSLIINDLELCLDDDGLRNQRNGFAFRNEGGYPNRGLIYANPDEQYFPKGKALENYSGQLINRRVEWLKNKEIELQKKPPFFNNEFIASSVLDVPISFIPGWYGVAAGAAKNLGVRGYFHFIEDKDGTKTTLTDNFKDVLAKYNAVLKNKDGKAFNELCKEDWECNQRLLMSNITGTSQFDEQPDNYVQKRAFEIAIGEEDLKEVNNIAETKYKNYHPSEEEIQQLNKQKKEIAKKITKKDEEWALETMKANKKALDIANQAMKDVRSFQKGIKKEMQSMNGAIQGLAKNDQLIMKELEQHRGLIEQNSMDIGILQNIMIGNLDERQQLQLYNACEDNDPNTQCPSNLMRLKSANGAKFNENKEKLARIGTAKDFINTASQIQQGMQAGYDLAVTLGLKGSDQEKVAEGMFYAQNVLGVGIGVAQIYSGNVFGGSMAVIQGVTSLIGGPGGQEPSPEMQAISQLREEMNLRFDELNLRIDTIMEQQKLFYEDLAENIRINREIMQYEFNNINYQLAEVINNQDAIRSQLRTLLNSDFNNCFTINNVVIKEDPILRKLNNLQNYIDIYNIDPAGCDACMDGLRNRLAQSNGTFFDGVNINLSTFQVEQEVQYAKQEFDAFRKTASLFKWFYGDIHNNLERATQMLLLPQATIDENQNTYIELRNDTIDFELNPDQVLSNIHYLDVYAFNDFMEIYRSFYPFFELQNSEQGTVSYRPFTAEEYIDFGSSEIPEGGVNLAAARKRILENQIESLSKISDIMLAQQSLMSGHLLIQPLYYILYQHQFTGHTIRYNNRNFSPRQMAIEILNANPILSKNFTNYVLRKNYRLNEVIYRDSSLYPVVSNNINFQHFKQWAYNNTHPMVYDTVLDSIIVDSTATYGISSFVLENKTYIDSLHFLNPNIKNTDIPSDVVFLQIKVSDVEEECSTTDFVSCKTSLPIPEAGEIQSNQFNFTEGFEFASKTVGLVEQIKQEIFLPYGLNDNFLELSQFKLGLLGN